MIPVRFRCKLALSAAAIPATDAAYALVEPRKSRSGNGNEQVLFVAKVRLYGALWLTPARRATSRSENVLSCSSATSASAAPMGARRRSP